MQTTNVFHQQNFDIGSTEADERHLVLQENHPIRQGEVMQIKESRNLFAKCSLVASTSEIDMSDAVGNYELTAVPHSLMTPDGLQIHGGERKADLFHCIVEDVGGYSQQEDFEESNTGRKFLFMVCI